MKYSEIKSEILNLTVEERGEVFKALREDQIIHPLEKEFGARAEIILEAISRSGDLTKRGIRGIIAEATFKVEVLKKSSVIVEVPFEGEKAYDFLVNHDGIKVSIQVKMQRQKNHRPMMANEGYRFLSNEYFVVETQRTRGGKVPKTGEDTRPYRFGEFDILAVSMHPSTKNWADFRYTISDWLLPRSENEKQLLKFQPVSKMLDDDWTNDLVTALDWFKKGKKKKISGYN